MATPKQSSSAELMSAYLDEELEASEAEAFESYLAESPDAQAELEDLRRVMTLVAGLPDVEAPEDFYEKLSRKLRRKQLLAPEGAVLGLVSLPFQVLSIVVILTVAALYMMAQLEQAPRAIEAEDAAKPASQGALDDPATD
jgi:anti-sigma factor RsiW